MSRTKVLHFGLQRAGTNYLKELLLQKYELVFLNEELDRTHPLHKHFRLYKNKDLIANDKFRNDNFFQSFKDFEINTLNSEGVDLCLFISKDPYSWYLSYKKWGKKNNWPVSPHHEIIEYVEFHRQWLKFAREDERVVHIKYQNLLSNSETCLRELEQKFHLKKLPGSEELKQIRKVPMSHRFSKRKHRYYTREKYIKELKKKELTQINKFLDDDFMNEMGYRKIIKKDS